ncbi:bacteriochlorophyll 4-vinyl reductase [Roseibium denhamense]|nr:bacteriochlorophyll 4-vinyl reductase [Roseibium denhamense]
MLSAPNTPAGVIGPNALTQFLDPIDRQCGPDVRKTLLKTASIAALPDMSGLIPEGPVARFHQAVRRTLPHFAEQLCRQAGTGTADYVLQHRIPKPAQFVLRHLPPPVSAKLLAKAIARNAWTFSGSGQFQISSKDPLVLKLFDNPLIAGEVSQAPICFWNTAVFERLYQVLVNPAARVKETSCMACGDPSCDFEVTFR